MNQCHKCLFTIILNFLYEYIFSSYKLIFPSHTNLSVNEILEELEKYQESEESDEEENTDSIIKEKVDVCNIYISSR